MWNDSNFNNLDEQSKLGYLYLKTNVNGLGLVPKFTGDGLTPPLALLKGKEGNAWYWLPKSVRKPQNPNIFKNWLGSLVELVESEPILVRLVLNHLTKIVPLWATGFTLPFTRAKRLALRRLRALKKEEGKNNPNYTCDDSNHYHSPNAEFSEIFNHNFVGNDPVYSLEEIEGYFASYAQDSSEIQGFEDFNQLETMPELLSHPLDNIGISGNHYHTQNTVITEENGFLSPNTCLDLQENTTLEPNKDNEPTQDRNHLHAPNTVIIGESEAKFVAQDSKEEAIEGVQKLESLPSSPLSLPFPSPSSPPVLPPHQPLPNPTLESPSSHSLSSLNFSCPKHIRQPSLEGLEIPDPPKKKLGIPKNFDPLKTELPFDSDEFFEAWENFVQSRNENKHPLTPSACKAFAKKFAKFTEPAVIEALNVAAERGYRGVFPESVVNKRTLPPEIEAMLDGLPRHAREQTIMSLIQLELIDPIPVPVDAVG